MSYYNNGSANNGSYSDPYAQNYMYPNQAYQQYMDDYQEEGQEFDKTEEEIDEEMQRELAEDAPWKKIQQNTFTRWANEHLKLVNKRIDDLQWDMGDGLNLISLIEVLSHKKLPRHNRKPMFRSQKLENISVALDFLENVEHIKLVNIDSTHLVDGKLKLILGLIWTLILHYSITMPMWEGESTDPNKRGKYATPKQKLLDWINSRMPPDLPIVNFTTDWNDGRAIGALVDSCAPGLYPDWQNNDPNNKLNNAKEAMDLAEKWLGIPQLIRPEEMVDPKVDEQSMMTYLSQYPNAKIKQDTPLKPKTDPNRVRCYGKGIEPTGNLVDAPTKFFVETFNAGNGDVEVIILNPKGQKEPSHIEFNNDKNQTYTVAYTPTMEGNYKVIVKFAGQEVAKSPFNVYVEGKVGDPSKCRAHGPGIEPNGVVVDRPTYFEIDASNAGNGMPEVIVLDPSDAHKPIPSQLTPLGNGCYRVDYVAKEPGLHSVNVFFAGKPIPNSPFGVNVAPSCDAKKCRAFGRGLQPRGVRVGDVADFRVLTKDAGEGILKVAVKGPDGYDLPVRCNKVNPTTYEGGYNPTREGPHQVHITYGGAHIPKSVFHVEVGPYKESMIRAFGPGLEGGVVGYPADFVVETNGETGSLGFSIEGPSQARIDCTDNLDGSANVTYWPTAVGEYAVHVLCDGEDIPGSPFMAWIEPRGNFDPTLVKAYGPGVDKDTPLIINKPVEFTVDCREAGEAPLRVVVTDSDYQKLDVAVKNNGNGTYTCRYTPIYPNRHTVFITYGGVAIPKSPIRMWAVEPSNPGKVRVYGPGVENGIKTNQPTYFTVDCKGAGSGDVSISITSPRNVDIQYEIDQKSDEILEVRYEPKIPGIYCISVTFNNQEIPQSPIKVLIEPDIDVGKIKITGIDPSNFIQSPTEFTVDARSITNTGTGKVQVELTGPSGKRHLCPVQNNGDGTYTVHYVPNEVGPYLIDVTYENVPVPGSTFRTQGIAGCDPRRVKVYGPGLEGGITNTPCQFTVETKGCGQGSLSLAIEGPSEAKMFCKENQNGICIMEYLPVKAGPYDITIKYADQDVPGSPYRVYIEDKVDSNKVNLQLPKKPFRVNTPSDIMLDARTAGKSDPHVDLYDSHNRIKPIQLVPQHGAVEGLFSGTVVPNIEGPHKLDVKWNGAPIPGSPFHINVLPKFEPHKVKVDGPGIRHGVHASLPATFIVDTKEAGEANLEIVIKDPEGNLVQTRIEDNSDGTYTIYYVPEDVGRYTISVLYGGIPVKDSPFNVKVDPIGDASKCHVYGPGLQPVIQIGEAYTITVDTRDAGQGNVTCHIRSANGNDLDIDIEDNNDGTFNIFYTPHNPGSYTIKIKFGGQDVPNGDVVVMAGDDSYLNQQQATKSNYYSYQPQKDSPLSPHPNYQHHTITTSSHQQSSNFNYSNTSERLEPFNLRIPVSEISNLGLLVKPVSARVKMPSGKVANPNVEQNADGTVSIKYQPCEVGLHELSVFYNGQPIQGSPFKFHVDAINSLTGDQHGAGGYVTAYGPGLSHGVCNEPCEFRIVTKDAGTGGLSVAVEGPSKAEIQCRDNKNGTCDVVYYPTAPGEYTITVKFADKHIVGSPFVARITGDSRFAKRNQLVYGGNQSDISLKVIEGDVNDLHATIRSPSGHEEPCLLKKLSNGSLGISFTPREVGEHVVSVLRDGKHIKNSPFRIEVRQSEIGDASKVKLYGKGLNEATANRINEFFVNTKDAGYGGLSLSIEGPSKADIECHDNEDGSCRVTYKPTEPGTYLINVKFADKHVPGSPFTVTAGGTGRLTEKITRDRKAVDITHIGSQCELSLKIPGSSPFDMAAYVTNPSGVTEDCEIVDMDDCNYCIRFVPKEMGIHTVSVKHKEMHIPGSPFEFTVGPIQGGGAHKVRAAGSGLIKGEVNQPVDFNIYTREAGAGALAIAIEGPAKAEIDFHDRKDGTCGVSYICPEPGEYQVSIKFNDEHIPESPFTAIISPPLGDARKLTIHSLRTKGLEVNKPCTFSVNVNGARGKIDAKVISPSGIQENCLCQEMDDDHYAIRFIPYENGMHWVHVRFNGNDIPESPFRVSVGQVNADPGRVFASGHGLSHGETGKSCEFLIDTLNAGAGPLAVTVDGPAKVQLDCKEVPEGYKVSFVPSAPGDYLITIKFVGTNIAGSPFKCRVTGQSLGRQITVQNGREHSNIVFEAVEKSRATAHIQSLQKSMHSDASKVKVKGTGIQKAFRNQKAQFVVDTKDAGNNMLMVGVYGPKTPCEEVVIKHIGNQQYQVNYCIKDKGEYMLIVKYGDQHIPGSPFTVEVV